MTQTKPRKAECDIITRYIFNSIMYKLKVSLAVTIHLLFYFIFNKLLYCYWLIALDFMNKSKARYNFRIVYLQLGLNESKSQDLTSKQKCIHILLFLYTLLGFDPFELGPWIEPHFLAHVVIELGPQIGPHMCIHFLGV